MYHTYSIWAIVSCNSMQCWQCAGKDCCSPHWSHLSMSRMQLFGSSHFDHVTLFSYRIFKLCCLIHAIHHSEFPSQLQPDTYLSDGQYLTIILRPSVIFSLFITIYCRRCMKFSIHVFSYTDPSTRNSLSARLSACTLWLTMQMSEKC